MPCAYEWEQLSLNGRRGCHLCVPHLSPSRSARSQAQCPLRSLLNRPHPPGQSLQQCGCRQGAAGSRERNQRPIGTLYGAGAAERIATALAACAHYFSHGTTHLSAAFWLANLARYRVSVSIACRRKKPRVCCCCACHARPVVAPPQWWHPALPSCPPTNREAVGILHRPARPVPIRLSACPGHAPYPPQWLETVDQC